MLVFFETPAAAAYAGVQHIQHRRAGTDAMNRCNARSQSQLSTRSQILAFQRTVIVTVKCTVVNMPGAWREHGIDNEQVMDGWVSTGTTQRASKSLQRSRPKLSCCFNSVPIRTRRSGDVKVQLQQQDRRKE